MPAGLGRGCGGDAQAQAPKEGQQLNDLGGGGGEVGCALPKLEICLHLWEQPCTPTQKGTLIGKGAEATGPQPCPDPGLEAYLTSQTNAKEKADAGWGWGDSGFLEVSLGRQRDSPFLVQITLERWGTSRLRTGTKSILKGQNGSPCAQSKVPHGTSRSKDGGKPRPGVSPSPRAGEQGAKASYTNRKPQGLQEEGEVGDVAIASVYQTGTGQGGGARHRGVATGSGQRAEVGPCERGRPTAAVGNSQVQAVPQAGS